MTGNGSHDFYNIDENIKHIRENIAAAALEANRNVDDIRLMAVTKTVECERINHALSQGIDLIGENKVQEFLSKKENLQLDGVETHLIGHLQTNKVRQIVTCVDMIQSVDSIKLAREISKYSQKMNMVSDVLIEVNIGREESKGGILPEALPEIIHEISEMGHIFIRGLMAIPPICEKKCEIREFFCNMRKLFIDNSTKKIDNIDMGILSMGMSDDYYEAVLEGSTMLRIGSSIFGKRNYT